MTAQERLQESRVDLVELIDNGIPAREYIPGTNGVLPVGKRLHISAPRKTGKSLVVGVVLALRIVKEGGSVAVLDRENGEEEYARRMASVMEAWNANETLGAKIRTSYSYYAFPQMELSWGCDPSYGDAFAHNDVVVFDSSRSHLTPLSSGRTPPMTTTGSFRPSSTPCGVRARRRSCWTTPATKGHGREDLHLRGISATSCTR